MRSLLLLLLLLLTTTLSAQTEAFNDFAMTITIDSTGDGLVTERITATATGKQIKRGITRVLRGLPVGDDETGKKGLQHQVISVSRDGEAIAHSAKNRGGFKTVYLGSKQKKIAAGQYDYELRYRAPDRIYQLDDQQEIRWSVFSSDLKLPVGKASVVLELPTGIAPLATSCYVGGAGSTDASRCTVVQNGWTLTYTVTDGFRAGEGLQIGAAFPLGSFPEPETVQAAPPPTPLQRRTTSYISLAGLLAALFYGIRAWQRYGVDPPTPEVGAQYYPVEGYSPAALAYVNTGYVSQRQLTASLTALTIKGYLDITEETEKGWLSSSDHFTLRPRQDGIARDLPPEQAVLYDRLHAAGDIRLDGEYDATLAKATKFHHDRLTRDYKAFVSQGNNLKKLIPFALILVVAIAAAAFGLKHADTTGIVLFVSLVAMLIIGSGIFAWLIAQPSPEKVKLWAKTKAFKKYLKLKESDRKMLPNAPEMTKDYLEQILPYAIALGVENDWADDLAADLSQTVQQPQDPNNPSHLMMTAPYLNSSFGSKLNTAYQSTSTQASSGGSVGGGGVSAGGGGSGGF